MASKIEICNIALSFIRGRSINSFEEASNEAQQCRLHYDIARKFALRDAQWKFANKTASLQLRSEEPLKWAYAYQYPGDCLKLRMVTADWYLKSPVDINNRPRSIYGDNYVDLDAGVPYEVLNAGDNMVIVTDLANAYVEYTLDVTNTVLFDPTFTDAFSYYLASRIAVPLTGADIGRAMREDALKLYSSTLSSAVANDINEQKRKPRQEPSLVQIRR